MGSTARPGSRSARLSLLPTLAAGPGFRLAEARSPRARLLGLAMLDDLPAGFALLIPRCRSVHTFGMRFPLDLAFLDEGGRALRVVRGVPPGRIVSCRGAAAVLEKKAARVSRPSRPAPSGGSRARTGRAPRSR